MAGLARMLRSETRVSGGANKAEQRRRASSVVVVRLPAFGLGLLCRNRRANKIFRRFHFQQGIQYL